MQPFKPEALPEVLGRYRESIDRHLERELEERYAGTRLKDAICYTSLAGGKRLRPILVCLAAEAVGGRGEEVLSAACGIELLHDASLVLDDLPCMDDARYRRWKDAAHVSFGEADSLLAAVSLISSAFELFGRNARERGCTAEETSALISRTSRGIQEAVEGQARDLALRREDADLATLEACYGLKSGSVLALALALGGTLAGGTMRQVAALERFGYDTGVAFQLVDDMFDGEDSASASGKAVSRPRDYLQGVDRQAALDRIKELLGRGVAGLGDLGGNAQGLVFVAQWAIETRLEQILSTKG